MHIARILRGLPGGSKSALTLGTDGNLWVVKFQNNPQHNRVLANDYMVSQIFKGLGLTTPNVSVATIADDVMLEAVDRKLIALQPTAKEGACHFASQYVGGLLPGVTRQVLLDNEWKNISNLREFAGVLAADLWTLNADRRQAVFYRKPGARKYRAFFIDQGNCLNADGRQFMRMATWAAHPAAAAYNWIRSWTHFEPWLSRIQSFPESELLTIADGIPPAWYSGNYAQMLDIVQTLLLRRSRVRNSLPICCPLFEDYGPTSNPLRLIGTQGPFSDHYVT